MRLAYLGNIRFPSERAHGAQIAHMCEAFVQNDVKAGRQKSLCEVFV